MTRFRPCIDLHDGRVKQIVGGSLRDNGPGPDTNFESEYGSDWFATRYRADTCTGGHVIKLGPGNDDAARAALAAWPGGLQVGGGINGDNAHDWLDAGASHVIVTSWLFSKDGTFLKDNLVELSQRIGADRLVVDLSCRRDADGWIVAMNRWQTPTDLRIEEQTLKDLSAYCAEFLIHAADVEGLRSGMDDELIKRLGEWCDIPVTYAGGASSLDDLARVNQLSNGKVDLTIGSALDLFGGDISYADCVSWNQG